MSGKRGRQVAAHHDFAGYHERAAVTIEIHANKAPLTSPTSILTTAGWFPEEPAG